MIQNRTSPQKVPSCPSPENPLGASTAHLLCDVVTSICSHLCARLSREDYHSQPSLQLWFRDSLKSMAGK